MAMDEEVYRQFVETRRDEYQAFLALTKALGPHRSTSPTSSADGEDSDGTEL